MQYETEEQQVEALKQWWKDNAKSVITGVIVGIGGLFGWQSWLQYQQTHAEAASAHLMQLMTSVDAKDYDSAQGVASTLQTQFDDTPYAGLAGLLLAKSAIDKGDTELAKQQLKWVAANAVQDDVDELARLRLARLFINEGKLDEAAQIAEISSPAFRPMFVELKGDIAFQRGDMDGARSAYQEALKLGPANPSLLQLKLDDLGSAATAAS